VTPLAIDLFTDEADIASAQGHFVHVYVDRATGRPVPISDAVKTAIQPLLRNGDGDDLVESA
jgi:acyl-CoA thioester hydrolase